MSTMQQFSSPIVNGKGKGRVLFRGDTDNEEEPNAEEDENDGGRGFELAGGNDADLPEIQDYDDHDAQGVEYDDLEGEGDNGLDAIEEESEQEEEEEEELPPEPEETILKGKKRRQQQIVAADDSGHVPDDTGEIFKAAKKKKRRFEDEDASGPCDLSSSILSCLLRWILCTGLRRSGRDTTKPMEHWRNEKVVYRRRDSGMNVYYEKIGIESKPKPPIRSLVKKGTAGKNGTVKNQGARTGGGARDKTRSMSAVSNGDEDDRPDMAQWDEETDPDGIVWDYVDGKESRRRRLLLFPFSCFC